MVNKKVTLEQVKKLALEKIANVLNGKEDYDDSTNLAMDFLKFEASLIPE